MADINKAEKPGSLFEFEGASVEEAIEKAVSELKVPKEKIKITILTEGHRGLFGQPGAKNAKIHATILPTLTD